MGFLKRSKEFVGDVKNMYDYEKRYGKPTAMPKSKVSSGMIKDWKQTNIAHAKKTKGVGFGKRSIFG